MHSNSWILSVNVIPVTIFAQGIIIETLWVDCLMIYLISALELSSLIITDYVNLIPEGMAIISMAIVLKPINRTR